MCFVGKKCLELEDKIRMSFAKRANYFIVIIITMATSFIHSSQFPIPDIYRICRSQDSSGSGLFGNYDRGIQISSLTFTCQNIL